MSHYNGWDKKNTTFVCHRGEFAFYVKRQAKALKKKRNVGLNSFKSYKLYFLFNLKFWENIQNIPGKEHYFTYFYVKKPLFIFD